MINNGTVAVSSPSIDRPVATRNGWANNPEGCKLHNRDCLPASPFRTDESKPVSLGQFFRQRIAKEYSLQPDK